MEITREDVLNLEQKSGGEVLDVCGDLARVRYQDQTFSVWQKDEAGKLSPMGLAVYSAVSKRTYPKYVFDFVGPIIDGVFTILRKERVPGTQREFYAGKHEPVWSYGVVKNGRIVASKTVTYPYNFSCGMGRFEQNGKYGFLTVDRFKNFVYFDQIFDDAKDFENGFAEVKGEFGKHKLIDKNLEVVEEDLDASRRFTRELMAKNLEK